MDQTSQLKEFQKILDEAPGKGDYRCPICWHRFETSEEKTSHLGKSHGYDVLEVTYAQSTGKETEEGSLREGA